MVRTVARAPRPTPMSSRKFPASTRKEATGTRGLSMTFDPPLTPHSTAFGAERLMFGSDWPICEVAGGYQRVMRALVELDVWPH